MTKNFEIIEVESGWAIRATTPEGENMSAWMQKNGSDDMLYSTPNGAAEAVQSMDRAIHNRGGKPWMIYKEKSAAQSGDTRNDD